jgi:hypothetical protein
MTHLSKGDREWADKDFEAAIALNPGLKALVPAKP